LSGLVPVGDQCGTVHLPVMGDVHRLGRAKKLVPAVGAPRLTAGVLSGD
jgi:hypothetical protein